LSRPAESSPEVAARQARRDLALGVEGPVPDVLQRLEQDAGVGVVVAHLPDGGPAGAYTVERDIPFILVNSSDAVVRQRFTLAHEFGHHRLHHGDMLDERIVWDTTDPREAAANRFGAEFLVPIAAVNLWFETHKYEAADLAAIVRLANDFGVSCEVALWRVKAARGIAERDADRLKRRLDAHDHWGMRAELGLAEIVDTLSSVQYLPVRVPARMTDDVLKALGAGIIDRAVAAQRLHVSTDQVEALAGRNDSDDE
jgi:Zn-dependent peptidase ImmA (M78 family)